MMKIVWYLVALMFLEHLSLIASAEIHKAERSNSSQSPETRTVQKLSSLVAMFKPSLGNTIIRHANAMVVVYDTEKFLPKLTFHKISTGTFIKGDRSRYFKNDPSVSKMLQALSKDYEQQYQNSLEISVFDTNKNYFARGHMIPYADFKEPFERELTNFMTNVAPMWQPLNNGNWKEMERILRNYVDFVGRELNVITLTGSEPLLGNDGNSLYLHGKVMVPKHLAKVVIDTYTGDCVVLYVEQPVGIMSNKKEIGCFGWIQEMDKGVIKSMSLEEAIQSKLFSGLNLLDFNIPKNKFLAIGDEMGSNMASILGKKKKPLALKQQKQQ